MSVERSDQAIVLTGNCGVEDVETLLDLLDGNTEPVVEFRSSARVHTALWQVLMLVGARMTGVPGDPFHRAHLVPALLRARRATPGRERAENTENH